MSKNIFFICVLIVFADEAIACDNCNRYLAINPFYNKNSIGLKYQYSYLEGTHLDDTELKEFSQDKKNFSGTNTSIELNGQWYPIQKLQVLFSIPYRFDKENVKSGTNNNNQARPTSVLHEVNGETLQLSGSSTDGIGDPVLLAHFQLFNRSGTDSGSFAHRLFAGVGIKFPLGSYKINPGEEAYERLHLPGSGSFDELLSVVYLAKIYGVGCNITSSYLITTKNSQSFKYGNRFNSNASFYYQINSRQFSFLPSIGVNYELSAKNKSGNLAMQNSGGEIIYINGGIDIYYKKVAIHLATRLPFSQVLNENQPLVKYKFTTGFSYAFNCKR